MENPFSDKAMQESAIDIVDEDGELLASFTNLEVRACKNDPYYPIELSVDTGAGHVLVALTAETLKRIYAECWIAGITIN